MNLSSVNGITSKTINKAALSALKLDSEDSEEEKKDDEEWDMVLNSTDANPKPVNMLKAIEATEVKSPAESSSSRLSQEAA